MMYKSDSNKPELCYNSYLYFLLSLLKLSGRDAWGCTAPKFVSLNRFLRPLILFLSLNI